MAAVVIVIAGGGAAFAWSIAVFCIPSSLCLSASSIWPQFWYYACLSNCSISASSFVFLYCLDVVVIVIVVVGAVVVVVSIFAVVRSLGCSRRRRRRDGGGRIFLIVVGLIPFFYCSMEGCLGEVLHSTATATCLVYGVRAPQGTTMQNLG